VSKRVHLEKKKKKKNASAKKKKKNNTQQNKQKKKKKQFNLKFKSNLFQIVFFFFFFWYFFFRLVNLHTDAEFWFFLANDDNVVAADDAVGERGVDDVDNRGDLGRFERGRHVVLFGRSAVGHIGVGTMGGMKEIVLIWSVSRKATRKPN
jgi:hypothetical protein